MISFNWDNIQTYEEPYPYLVCDDFIVEYNDEIFPSNDWCEDNLRQRENGITKSLGAFYTLKSEDISKLTRDFITSATSDDFHNKVFEILKIKNFKDSVKDIRRSPGDYRIAKECMPTTNSYSESPILDVHHDHPVTIWTALIYFSESEHGAFNIHNADKSLNRKIPIKKNRMILTLGSPKTFHSVDSWPVKDSRKYFYLTAEFKNSGRDKDGNAIGAIEYWFSPSESNIYPR